MRNKVVNIVVPYPLFPPNSLFPHYISTTLPHYLVSNNQKRIVRIKKYGQSFMGFNRLYIYHENVITRNM
jgi:hypothetical protein